MPTVFIAYRRNDTGGHAGRVYDRLAARWGKRHVTWDVEGIPPGIRYFDFVKQKVAESDCVLVLIGKHWLQAGNRERLHDPADLHRVEIEIAMGMHRRVIPVLINGAAMPYRAELPPALQELPDLNAFHLDESGWDDDMRRLVREIGGMSVLHRREWMGVSVAAVALIAWLGLNQFRTPADDAPTAENSVAASATDTGSIVGSRDTAGPMTQRETEASASAPAAVAASSLVRGTATCLPYGPDTVAITGRLERRMFYGPPGFGENPESDQREPGFYVVPDIPLCTIARDYIDAATSGVDLVQMVLDSAGYANSRPYLDQRVRATGTLFGAISGHHHAPILLDVHGIEPAHPPR